MFNSHMSYTELSRALYSSYKNQSLLSEYQLKHISRSLQNPLLEALLYSYPLAKNLQKFVQDSLEATARQNMQQETDFDVHSVVYGGRREITLQYLSKNYPPQDSNGVIHKIEKFLTNVLKEPEFQHQLLIAEAARYQTREKLYRQEILTTLERLYSIDEIIADFKDYLEYLSEQKQNRSTYAWDLLESIFQRQERLTVANELQQSYALLLFALDDSRTAYHDKNHQFVRGKNYTCQKGLLERLLDHHQSIVPEQTFKSDVASELISTLITPFVLQDYEMQEQECRQTCSQYLYHLYLKVAGYGMREQRIKCYAFKSDVDISALYKKYEQSLSSLSSIRKKQALFEWDLVIGQIKSETLVITSPGYYKIIFFLNEHNALKIVIKTHKKLSKRGRLKSEDEIFIGMLHEGPFIDKAHLELVLSLHDSLGTLETLRQTAELGTEVEESFISPSRTDMVLAYQKYLEESEQAFYPFIQEERFRQRLQDCHDPHIIGCSQTALSEWLERDATVLNQEQAERLACLCAQEGYGMGLQIFCQKYNVSPNHIDLQQNKSLLYIATQAGHEAVVDILIKAGADVDLPSRDGSSPLILASDKGHTAVVDKLIKAGAFVNFQNKLGDTALRLAVRAGHNLIIKMLLRAGASPELKNKSGNDAITASIANNQYSEIARGGKFAIENAIVAGDETSLKQLICRE